MRTNELFAKKTVFSFEVFPPKPDTPIETIYAALDELSQLHPDFISVTCGASGSGSGGNRTVEVASAIKHTYGCETAAHMPCIYLTEDDALRTLDELKKAGIENILALRGDIPQESDFPLPNQYRYACELIEEIKGAGDFCIGAACYPEGHVESENRKEDVLHLKEKVDRGVDFLTTQMFFDNSILYNFLYRIREAGVTVPVLPGIMPVTNKKQMKRICDMSGTVLPQRFLDVLDRFGDDPAAMQQAGIAYATDQIIDLFANGINHVHVYSMNKPEVAAAIMNNLSAIVKH